MGESVEGEVDASGRVRFEQLDPGRTRIEVTMNYADPPGGRIGEVVTDAVSNPERELREDLENFAQIVERGELKLLVAGRAPDVRPVREVKAGGASCPYYASLDNSRGPMTPFPDMVYDGKGCDGRIADHKVVVRSGSL